MSKTSKLTFLALLLSVSTFSPFYAQAISLQELIVDWGLVFVNAGAITSAIALIVFFFGLGKFIRNAGNEEGRETGRKVMIWGIVSMFIIFSIWGIVNFIRGELNIPDHSEIEFKNF